VLKSAYRVESLQRNQTVQYSLLEEKLVYNMHGHHTSALYLCAKRMLDILGASVGLLALLLFMPSVALAMLLTDRGPLFYKQTRVGQHSRPFTLYKLRTMVVDADARLARNPALLEEWRRTGKLQHDPRITTLGNFLRRTSIDELPQMLNVLRGEISLVGPRPIQFSEIPAFGELTEMRQIVKPGLTGFWQVSGRSTTDYEQRALLDCTYVMECSFWTDILILLETIPVVLHGHGAY